MHIRLLNLARATVDGLPVLPKEFYQIAESFRVSVQREVCLTALAEELGQARVLIHREQISLKVKMRFFDFDVNYVRF